MAGIGEGKEVLIRKSGNVIDVSQKGEEALPKELSRLLEPELQYKYIQRHYGRDQFDPITGVKRPVTVIPKRIYRYDKKGRLITNFGFVRRLVQILRENGYTILTEDLYPDDQRERPDCYKTSWENVTDEFEFRARQDECLAAVMKAKCGVIHAATGFGKMAVMAMICLLYPNAKIYVVTKGKSLVNKTREFLLRYLPNVGQFGASKKQWGSRITVFSVDSLHHCDFDCDIMLGDEGHLLITEEGSKDLVKFQSSRNFSLTATPTGRLDGTDKRLEALFGQTIFYLPYQEAVALGLVVPIRVEWSDVILTSNPVADIENSVDRKRRGIWTNSARNDVVARKALEFVDDQVMIMVDTVEHGVHLYQRLREHGYALVTGEIDPTVLKNYKKSGMLPQDHPRMTPGEVEKLRKKFEAGTLRRVITTIWDTGIDPVHLGVVIRAAGGASEIQDQQEPGRVSRIIRNEAGEMVKSVGVLCDFLDQFDRGFAGRASGRMRVYKSLGWENVVRRGDTERVL
jgi:superfamily II DNA or RNA helicase